MIRGALFFAISPLFFRKPGCSIRLFSVERVVYPPLLPLLSSCPSIRKEEEVTSREKGVGKEGGEKQINLFFPFHLRRRFFLFPLSVTFRACLFVLSYLCSVR